MLKADPGTSTRGLEVVGVDISQRFVDLAEDATARQGRDLEVRLQALQVTARQRRKKVVVRLEPLLAFRRGCPMPHRQNSFVPPR